MESDQLRKIATALREEAVKRETEKMIKCGQVLQAADALNRLRAKVTANVS